MKKFSVIQNLRLERDLSCLQLAKKSGLSHRAVLTAEKMTHRPRPLTVAKLSRGLEVSYEFLNQKIADDFAGQ